MVRGSAAVLLGVLGKCRTRVETDVRKEIAGRRRAVGDQSEDLRDEALLHAGILTGVSAESLVTRQRNRGKTGSDPEPTSWV